MVSRPTRFVWFTASDAGNQYNRRSLVRCHVVSRASAIVDHDGIFFDSWRIRACLHCSQAQYGNKYANCNVARSDHAWMGCGCVKIMGSILCERCCAAEYGWIAHQTLASVNPLLVLGF